MDRHTTIFSVVFSQGYFVLFPPVFIRIRKRKGSFHLVGVIWGKKKEKEEKEETDKRRRLI